MLEHVNAEGGFFFVPEIGGDGAIVFRDAIPILQAGVRLFVKRCLMEPPRELTGGKRSVVMDPC